MSRKAVFPKTLSRMSGLLHEDGIKALKKEVKEAKETKETKETKEDEKID